MSKNEDELEEYRSKIREWIRNNVPEEISSKGDMAPPEILREWQRRIYEAGYLGVSWPKEYGGWGENPIKEIIVREEFAKAGVPYATVGLGVSVVGPAIILNGTEEQKKKYIRRILTAEDIWCQGFSEPQAGSDLAGIKTKAEDKGDHFLVNGQKIWSSYAHLANYCLLLTRTGDVSERHKGLTMLVVDMKSEGIRISPIKQITGRSEFNTLYFSNVKVPKENVVGNVGEGWKVAMSTLNYERLNIGTILFTVERLVRELSINNEQLFNTAEDIVALKSFYKRVLERLKKGYVAGPEAAVIKLVASEAIQRVYENAVANAGIEGLVMENGAGFRPEIIYGLLASRAITIAGGTSEILRNLLGEVVLGLPKG
ncbi:acyl-CoA dehydrogenase domain protein [Sulfolobus islandicus Y.G.57.14]|jgi:alkylation response protein AidB-like acyl-CoA dehydrogenase|uniref:Acyl-CoA dehydrogenase domain protein n=4 Tax=Saccharolobus islandicus TaxID=43080 RepID=C3MKV7_SACI2|nr:acyl-CoA dehydrogenase family protein [Sulfolobus islandicus]ACP34482.1 acyl-CoA dehydrogenase domain protein [Sulfolobus islandicus L.S.2.15]ACP44597.1 acyl-CoA dehydrogenase domain protein [Sulfolobus islandicus Y.G.57.14]ACP49811.1 acyl-CoA dehydrogenase domain protein [Sulfolobus islandicus Y.N.15.51]ADB86104.1 acyl-CoA dehydrogenase domain protein [Sulfolobus islandicus L.D.8.5]PVU77108.1 acyl-CoA dehydrogenase [Sulfolobus islandicus]